MKYKQPHSEFELVHIFYNDNNYMMDASIFVGYTSGYDPRICYHAEFITLTEVGKHFGGKAASLGYELSKGHIF